MRPQSIEELRALYRRWERGNPYANRDEVWENWICFLRETETAVGGMQATILPGKVAYLAYVTYTDHQRQGYAREAAQVVLHHLGNIHGIERVLVDMHSANEASIKVAESLGFVRVEDSGDLERHRGIQAGEFLYELKL